MPQIVDESHDRTVVLPGVGTELAVAPARAERDVGDQQRTHREKCLTVTDFGGLDVGIPQAMRRSIDFAANSHGIGAG